MGHPVYVAVKAGKVWLTPFRKFLVINFFSRELPFLELLTVRRYGFDDVSLWSEFPERKLDFRDNTKSEKAISGLWAGNNRDAASIKKSTTV